MKKKTPTKMISMNIVIKTDEGDIVLTEDKARELWSMLDNIYGYRRYYTSPTWIYKSNYGTSAGLNSDMFTLDCTTKEQ